MRRRADGRTAGRPARIGTMLAAILAVAASGRPAVAQVGHPPGDSPFRDITIAAGPVVFAGYLFGDRGKAEAGPSNALAFGARYELPTGRSLLVQLTAAYLRAERFIIDSRADSASPARRTGPVDMDLLHLDVGLQLRLTGAKTWHGLAPYVGAGIGMAIDVNSPGDTTNSGYHFGNKLTFGGGVGVRWYVARQFTVHADTRLLLWRLKYPIAFRDPAPDGSRVVPLDDKLTDWTTHPWLSLGVGWTF
ncbi:MAG: hypothetical protein ACREMN_11070 [Gemmatimonadales bacterium]